MAFDFPIGLLLILLSDNGVYTNSSYDFLLFFSHQNTKHSLTLILKSNIRSFEDYGVSFFYILDLYDVTGYRVFHFEFFHFLALTTKGQKCTTFRTIWNDTISNGTPCSKNLDFAKLPHWKHVWELSKILTAHIISKIFKSIPSIHTQYLLAQSFIITL